jgi:hypothetical protein
VVFPGLAATHFPFAYFLCAGYASDRSPEQEEELDKNNNKNKEGKY